MTKGDWNRVHMMADLMFRVGTAKNPNTNGDADRLNEMYEWFTRTKRSDIIAEAERIANKKYNERMGAL